MVMSSNGEDKSAHIYGCKFTFVNDKFDPIQLPAAKYHCQERYLKEKGISFLLLKGEVPFEKKKDSSGSLSPYTVCYCNVCTYAIKKQI